MLSSLELVTAAQPPKAFDGWEALRSNGQFAWSMNTLSQPSKAFAAMSFTLAGIRT